MALCPQCDYEIQDNIDVCPECGAAVEKLTPCVNCGEKNIASADYCPKCGILHVNDEKIACENHPEIDAVAVCIICGKPVCAKCRKVRMNKTFCEDDKHVQVYQNWAVVYTSSTEYEAEMVKANIQNTGIDCMIFNQQDHAYFLTVGSMARINIMVPAEKLAEAKKILNELKRDTTDE